MPAVVAGLTLSQIQNWDVEHLETAAQQWNSTAKLWEDSFESIHRGSLNPGGTAWEGPGAEAAQERTFTDLVKVRGLAEALREAASAARRGASDLRSAQRETVTAIEAAQDAGFAVAEDLSVTDTNPLTSLLPGGGRQAQAQTLASDIATRAAALSTLDNNVATEITTLTTPLDNVGFDETPSDGIQAVDYTQSTAPDEHSDIDSGLRDLMVGPTLNTPAPFSVPNGTQKFYDELTAIINANGPEDPAMAAARQAQQTAYDAMHQGCSTLQWTGSGLVFVGSTTAFAMSLPAAITPPGAAIAIATGLTSLGSGSLLADCYVR